MLLCLLDGSRLGHATMHVHIHSCRIFQLALEKARTKEAIHVGDSYVSHYMVWSLHIVIYVHCRN